MTEYLDRYPTVHEYAEGKRINPKLTDRISRAGAIDAVVSWTVEDRPHEVMPTDLVDRIKALPSADAVHGEWIPCGEKMPKELERVNVTWLNHNPPFYYQHIKDIPQTDTAVWYRGKWYWWDATVIDILAEYGEDCNAEQIDKDIEVIAWMPLPKPYGERREP